MIDPDTGFAVIPQSMDSQGGFFNPKRASESIYSDSRQGSMIVYDGRSGSLNPFGIKSSFVGGEHPSIQEQEENEQDVDDE